MVLSSNNSLFFFRFWNFFFRCSWILSHFFDLTLGTRFFCSRCLSMSNDFSGVVQRRSKNEKKKENGQKDSVSGSNREKIKMGSHAPPIQFLRREIQIKGSIWRQRDLIKPSGICIQLGFSRQPPKAKKNRLNHDKMIITI